MGYHLWVPAQGTAKFVSPGSCTTKAEWRLHSGVQHRAAVKGSQHTHTPTPPPGCRAQASSGISPGSWTGRHFAFFALGLRPAWSRRGTQTHVLSLGPLLLAEVGGGLRGGLQLPRDGHWGLCFLGPRGQSTKHWPCTHSNRHKPPDVCKSLSDVFCSMEQQARLSGSAAVCAREGVIGQLQGRCPRLLSWVPRVVLAYSQAQEDHDTVEHLQASRPDSPPYLGSPVTSSSTFSATRK